MSKRCLLFVEDYPPIQELYGDVLEDDGFDVDIVPDGEHALEKVKNHHYDAILVDILLPNMGGLDFLEQFQKAPGKTNKKTQVIVLTDFDDPNYIERAHKLGVKNYWIKVNYTPHQLADQLKKTLRSA